MRFVEQLSRELETKKTHGSGGVEKAQFTSSNAYGKSSTVNCYTFAGGATAVTLGKEAKIRHWPVILHAILIEEGFSNRGGGGRGQT